MTNGKGVGTVRHFEQAKRDDGAAAVEFTLLLLPFILLCFGSISAGIVFSDKLSLTQGVREAARYGATLPYETTDPNATNFLTAIRDTAIGDTLNQLGPGSVDFCIGFRTLSGAQTNYFLANGSNSGAEGTCTGAPPLQPGSIVVLGTKRVTFELILANPSVTLVSISVARYEGAS